MGCKNYFRPFPVQKDIFKIDTNVTQNIQNWFSVCLYIIHFSKLSNLEFYSVYLPKKYQCIDKKQTK